MYIGEDGEIYGGNLSQSSGSPKLDRILAKRAGKPDPGPIGPAHMRSRAELEAERDAKTKSTGIRHVIAGGQVRPVRKMDPERFRKTEKGLVRHGPRAAGPGMQRQQPGVMGFIRKNAVPLAIGTGVVIGGILLLR